MAADTTHHAIYDELHLRPCKHQVAGHLFEDGKAGSLVDDLGHFYKPLQVGPRGERERAFYETIAEELKAEQEQLGSGFIHPSVPEAGPEDRSARSTGEAESSGRSTTSGSPHSSLPFSARNATMLEAVPKFVGVVEVGDCVLVELEDVTRGYRRPSIVDIKVGFRTWYHDADPCHIERCKLKDAATSQAALGFKICGMQVYRHCQRGYWKASKRWCKQLPLESVNKALVRFANNDSGLLPSDVYGGAYGAIEQLQRLESWFQVQRDFQFYSSSVLIIYEGDAESAEEANVAVRLVDFAHTFRSKGQKDPNFIAGLRAVIKALKNALLLDHHDCSF